MFKGILEKLFNLYNKVESNIYLNSKKQLTLIINEIKQETSTSNVTLINSAWASGSTKKSPDNMFVAKMEYANEIAMGSPTCGTIIINEEHFVIKMCSPSFIWSEDSNFIAASRWTGNRKQELILVNVKKKSVNYTNKIFDVFELYGFENNTIFGVDSPIYRPKKVVLNVEKYLN